MTKDTLIDLTQSMHNSTPEIPAGVGWGGVVPPPREPP